MRWGLSGSVPARTHHALVCTALGCWQVRGRWRDMHVPTTHVGGPGHDQEAISLSHRVPAQDAEWCPALQTLALRAPTQACLTMQADNPSVAKHTEPWLVPFTYRTFGTWSASAPGLRPAAWEAGLLRAGARQTLVQVSGRDAGKGRVTLR